MHGLSGFDIVIMYYISAEIRSFFKEIEYKFEVDQGIRDIEGNAMEGRITVQT
ncbi:unknown protein [Paenibacillus amylolyticus]|uniref:Uncharacterized protein n=1 Tax=Paenibacillus amylolyticus TaxID=1451 RepID=A0A100VU33_PAEAM|nr:unknown protein [Paenibacillus amylolyticus]